MVDVLLISNCFSFLSLPYLFEVRKVFLSLPLPLPLNPSFSSLSLPFLPPSLPPFLQYGFSGKVFATEPTKQLGRQLMEELCEYLYRTPTQSRDWRDETILQ